MNHSKVSGFSSSSVTVCSAASAKEPLRAAAKKGEHDVRRSVCRVYFCIELPLPTITMAKRWKFLNVVRSGIRGAGKISVGPQRW